MPEQRYQDTLSSIAFAGRIHISKRSDNVNGMEMASRIVPTSLVTGNA